MVFEDKSLAPYHGREPFIFISYSHRNSDQAAEIISTLNRAGFRVWYDEGLIPGREWDENIARIIMGCSYFIALLTEEYLASSNCKDELNYARDKNKPIVLIYLDEVSLPAGMELRLGRLFAVHRQQYATEEAFYTKVFSADGIARCNSRYIDKAVSKTQASSHTYQTLAKHVVAQQEEVKLNSIESSSGIGLRVFGIVLLLIVVLITGFVLYHYSGKKPNTTNTQYNYASYSVPPADSVEESHEASLDIEAAPEPESSAVSEEMSNQAGEEFIWLEPNSETSYDSNPSEEISVPPGNFDEVPVNSEQIEEGPSSQEPESTPITESEPAPTLEPAPTPTPAPTLTPTPAPVIEPTPVSEPENVVIIDPSTTGGTGNTLTASGSAAAPAG